MMKTPPLDEHQKEFLDRLDDEQKEAYLKFIKFITLNSLPPRRSRSQQDAGPDELASEVVK